ncbi:MAG: hypothetical protein H0V82_02915 [Candidatus Protochlamydia sp.]|nr:hypothetical protein [Candidatus Protochlamydia sp.]
MPFLHSSPELQKQRRIAAELLACTVWELFPTANLAGGGMTSYGFYYDFVFEQRVDETLLPLIETKLKAFVKEGHSLQMVTMMRQNAQDLLLHQQQPLLAELVEQEEQNMLNLVRINKFYGVCPFLDIASSDEIASLKLLEISTEQEEQGDVYTRITGTCFSDNQILKKFLKLRESYFKKKNHQVLGPELNLFSFPSNLSPLECFWHPKGEIVKNLLQQWLEEELQNHFPFQKVHTPFVVQEDKINLSTFEPFLYQDQTLTLSSTRLPQHIYLLKQNTVLSEEIRFLEWALLYKNEASLLNEGLITLPCQLEDFTTIDCSAGQLSKEFISSLLFIEQIITIFDFEAQWYVIASRQKSVNGRQEKETLKWMKKTLETLSLHFPLQEELLEEGCLEGPRLELRLADEMGREWAGPSLTIASNEANILIRRAFGPLGRLIALLIERWEGVFPLWLAPEQIRILAIGDLSHAYSKEVEASCRRRGLRAALDLRQVKLGEKIHSAEKEKIPYLLIIGDQEIKKQSVTVRSMRRPGKSESMKLEEILDLIQQECLRPKCTGPAEKNV